MKRYFISKIDPELKIQIKISPSDACKYKLKNYSTILYRNGINENWVEISEADFMSNAQTTVVTKEDSEEEDTNYGEETTPEGKTTWASTGNNADFLQVIPSPFEKVCQDMIKIHEAKNHDYGDSFHEMFKEFGFQYGYMHLKEKLNRIKTLSTVEGKVNSESLEDSLLDLANYAVMTLVELRNDTDRKG